MEYEKILTDMCIEILKLLYKMYLNGEITEEEYFEHIKLKLLYLRDFRTA